METGSFNEINGVDYHKKLLKKTSERNEARKRLEKYRNYQGIKTWLCLFCGENLRSYV